MNKVFYILISWICFITTANASLWTFFYGTTPKNGIFYLPYGFHTTNRDYKGNTRSRDFRSFQLMGGVYHSFYLSTFINSFSDRVWSLGIERDVFKLYRLHFGYGAGLMYGYRGKLADVDGIPFRRTFLVKHNINPLIVLTSHIDISEHVELKFVLEPLVIAGGIKLDFD